MPLYFPQDIEAFDTGNILTVNCTRSCICIFYVCEKSERGEWKRLEGVERVSRGLVSKQFEDLTPDSCCSCCWQLGQTVCGARERVGCGVQQGRAAALVPKAKRNCPESGRNSI